MPDIVQITANGIQKLLKKYDYQQAIAEYIWNGFDAKATVVQLNYESNSLGYISKMEIIDNGYGISREKLEVKFKPFLDSEKAIEIESPKNTSAVHGKNGVGRLTFFKFCTEAKWQTVYTEKGKIFSYPIRIKIDTLQRYDAPKEQLIEIKDKKVGTGTTVSFYNFLPEVSALKLGQNLLNFLCQEFGWFLELNKGHNYQLLINGLPLKYEVLIQENENFSWVDEESKTAFDINFVIWKESINKEYSKFYFIGSDQKERFKEFTSLNKKGDHFFHSVFIRSPYFDNFSFKSSAESIQYMLIGGGRNDTVMRRLYKYLTSFLQERRRPFLREYTDRLINEYEEEGVFPSFANNSWELLRKTELENVVKNLYEVQPKLFINLNIEQKKTFVRLLNLVLDSNERDQIFEILGEVVDLTADERAQMAEVLKATKLSRINQTIHLIEDRYKAISNLKELVLNEKLNANEVYHLQKLVEQHYWIFGEQYHLVTSAEQKFEEALRRHTYILTGTKKNKTIDHDDKQGEMDIFLCRQDILTNEIKNIIVELKHPQLKVGAKELGQVKKYMNVILNEPEFNGNNMTWDFYLIGSSFNKKREIEIELENAKSHGEKSLAFRSGQYKIYVKTWNEVFNDFEMKHQFLNNKLKLERSQLQTPGLTADEIVNHSVEQNVAAQKKAS